MKQISLKSLSLTNFRSFTGDSTIDFSTGAGLKLITGQNEVEPRLGANGCGKSTLWDAVCFALYGTSVRGLRHTDLISTGAKTVGVSLEMTIDGSTWVVHRTAPPMHITVDEGEPYDQEGIDRLVGLSKARFLNSVVFGQAVPLFLDLPVPARGELLDEVLDLELWLRAAGGANEKHREAAAQLIELRRAIARTQGRIEGLGDLERFAEQERNWKKQKQDDLKTLVAAVSDRETQLAELTEQYNDKDLSPVDETADKERVEYFQTQNTRAREKVAALNGELSTIIKTVELIDRHDNCPTCDQPITAEHKTQHFAMIDPVIAQLEKQRGIAQLDIQTTQDELAAGKLTCQSLSKANQERREARTRLQRRIDEVRLQMERLEAEAGRVTGETNPFTAEAARTKQAHARLQADLAEQQTEEAGLIGQASSLEYWKQGFRKVRLYCLDRVLKELEVETQNSLRALGLAGWQVGFTTASETKSGTVKLGVQVDIKAPEATRKFETMSGGESQRARLAVSLGLANLIQRWAGVRFGLEVFDEPTAWLSETGVEDLLESLRSRAEAGDRSIWVCDHRALAHAGFVEVMSITKTTEGSRIDG